MANHSRKLYYNVNLAPGDLPSNNVTLAPIVITDGTVAGTLDRYGNLMQVNGVRGATTRELERNAISAWFEPNTITAGAAAAGGAYAHIYDLTGAVPTIAIDAPYTLSNNGVMTADFTHTPGSANIVVVTPGTYIVEFAVAGLEANQLALMKHEGPGAVVTGDVVAGATFGSGAGTQPNTGFAIVTTTLANSTIQVWNRSSAAAVTRQTLAGGTVANATVSVLIRSAGSVGLGTGTPIVALGFLNAATMTPVTDPATVLQVALSMNLQGFSGATVTGTIYVQKQWTAE